MPDQIVRSEKEIESAVPPELYEWLVGDTDEAPELKVVTIRDRIYYAGDDE